MSQDPQQSDQQQPEQPLRDRRVVEEEQLSGTMFGGLQNLANALGSLSTTLAGFGIVAMVLGLVLLIFTSELRLYSYILMIAGGALVVVAMAVSYRAVGTALKGRRGRYSTNTLIMVLAFVGIAAVFNFIAFENQKRFDVTATKKFSLAPRSVDVLKDLTGPVEAKAFFGPARSPEERLIQDAVDDLLHEFDVRSSNFEYDFVDPDVNPETAREYGISPATGYGNIVFRDIESDKRHTALPVGALEQGFVTALIIVTGQEQKAVYFLQGHGERDAQNIERETDGYGLANDAVRSENYAVSSLNLRLDTDRERFALALSGDAFEGPIGEGEERKKEVNMVVVAGPTDELPAEEAQILDDYLKGGGNMLFLLDPDTPDSFRDFLARWGIIVGKGHILDTERSLGESNEITFLRRGQYVSQIADPLLSSTLQISKLTAGLDTVYYPGVTALSPAEEVLFYPPKLEEEEEEETDPSQEQEQPKILGAALAVTSPQSWLIEDPGRFEQQAGDIQGPFLGGFFPAIAIRALGPLDEELPEDLSDVNVASIIVFGDSDFASNGWFYTPDNSDFFLNSVNWLVGDIPLANIRPKPTDPRILVLTDNEYDFIRFSGWLLLPAVMAVAGGFVWWRRR